MNQKTTGIEDISERDAILADVLNSQVLGTSSHQIQLFTHLINAKFDGTLARVKAYTIAVDAFGRPKDFDGSLDSIVRVEMFRLRTNLKAFNEISETYRLELQRRVTIFESHERMNRSPKPQN